MKIKKKTKIKLFLPIADDFYEKKTHYTNEEKKMGITNKRLKPMKIRYLYEDIKNNINHNKFVLFGNFSKNITNHNKTITYKSTYFNTKISQMYDYSNIKIRLFDRTGYGFESLMNSINKKMNMNNLMYKNEEKIIRNKIKIGDKNQIINSSIIDDNKISNKKNSRNLYRKTMSELYSKIKKFKNE